jgi:MFS family permease
MGDLFGERRVFVTGLFLVLVASAAGPFMPNQEWMIVDRILLGMGTCAQFPAAMSIIRREGTRTGSRTEGAVGVIAICGQTTAALGPTIGGLLVLAGGWQAIFWINIPLVLNSAWWVFRSAPSDPPRRVRGGVSVLTQIDVPGLILFVATVVSGMWWLLSITDARAWLILPACVLSGTAFVFWELHCPRPFLDLPLLVGNRELRGVYLRITLAYICFYSIFYGFPRWLLTVRDFGPGVTGLLVLPVFVVGVCATAIAARMVRHVPPRVLISFSAAAFVLAGAVMALALSGSSPIVVIVLVAMALGIPNGLSNIGNQVLIQRHAPEGILATAAGLGRTSQYVGATLSTALAEFAFTSVSSEQSIPVFLGTVLVAGGAVIGVGNVLARRKRSTPGDDAPLRNPEPLVSDRT